MLEIKILGGGCANCKRLEQIARKVVENLGVEAEFIKVTNYSEIAELGVMSTPGLIVNGKVVSSGRIPAEIEIEEWIKAAVLAS
ncbi:MAG TPA: thioredoxin family protein [Anaerolineaceae bacterium]|nr:thioredoxin family protein [Anaerolineaceae bacterium]